MYPIRQPFLPGDDTPGVVYLGIADTPECPGLLQVPVIDKSTDPWSATIFGPDCLGQDMAVVRVRMWSVAMVGDDLSTSIVSNTVKHTVFVPEPTIADGLFVFALGLFFVATFVARWREGR